MAKTKEENQVSGYHHYRDDLVRESLKNIHILGLTERAIQHLFGDTIGEIDTEEYRKDHAVFMLELEHKLAQQMIIQAMGYSYQEETIFYKSKRKNGIQYWEPAGRRMQTKHQPGNAQLFMMFMTNKFPDMWKISKELISRKEKGYDSQPRERVRKQIDALSRGLLEADTDAAGRQSKIQKRPEFVFDDGDR